MNLSLKGLLLMVGICCLLIPEAQTLSKMLFRSKDTTVNWNTEILDYEPEMKYFKSLRFEPETMDPNDLDVYLENFEDGWRGSMLAFMEGDIQISRASTIPWHGGIFRTNDFIMREHPEDFDPTHSNWIGMRDYGKIKGWSHCFLQLKPLIDIHGGEGARKILRPASANPTPRYTLICLMVAVLVAPLIRNHVYGESHRLSPQCDDVFD